ncbi:MAG TPA: two-component regulator propeller domain-containing protein [Acidobacteriaceae bacterium]|nr:two-component regulator propeller domain-containing protein [Acidobacteriaceae bacterium]
MSRRTGWIATPVLAMIMLATQTALALDPGKAITQYMQTSWTSESGLPQNSVQAMAQTEDGYLWFGTQEGLTRFDGMHFTTYTRHNAPKLASSFIQTMTAGRDGSLWIGTDSGLTHYQPPTLGGPEGVFTTLTTNDGLSGNLIEALCEDREGGLWVGTSRGLDRIFNGHVQNWTTSDGLADLSISAIAMDRGGTVWVGTAGGLARFEHGRFTTLTTHDGLPGDGIVALAAAPDGSVWVGTQGNGLAEIRDGHVTAFPERLPWNEIAALLIDHDGALWISFDRHGIARLDHGKLDFYDASRGLPSDRCSRALFEDREGSLWIGSLDGGVAQLRNGKFSVFGTPEGLSGNYTGNVLQAQDGTMWIGADDKGLDHLLPDGRVEVWGPRNGLPNQAVYSMVQTRDGDLWVGYRRGTLARIHNKQVTTYHDAQAGEFSVNSLLEDRDGTLWIGFEGKGLARFEQSKIQHVTDTGRIAALAQSTDGALWIGFDGDGVQRVANGVTTNFTTANGLHSDHVMSLYADADGSMWVGTQSGGLSHIRNDKVMTWTPDQEMPDTTIGSILADDNGNFWFGGDTGIFRIAKSELSQAAGQPAAVHPVVYGTADGLRSRETLYGSMPCAWKSRDGRLWFGTIEGVAVIDPTRIPVNNIVPPVWIERVKLDSHNIPLQDHIHLGPGSGNLEVAFSAPSFVAPQRERFRYKLIGFDPDWNYSGGRRSAWYTNLPAGNYTFTVQAENNDGLWNETGASFSFTLRPPLSRTPEAYACYVMLALLLAWAVIAFRTRSLTLRQQELTRIVAERTAQLEAEKAALEATRRELHIQATHDSLTGIFNRAAMLEHLQREISRATRDHSPLGVLIADLDHFKSLNDNYGHLCGDDVIRESAERFRSSMRGYDIVGRYGGEEFLILFPGWDLMLAPGRVDDLLESIRSRPFEIGDSSIRLTCSIGVATFRPETDSPSIREVLSRADTALYVAKNSGRNCVSFEVRPQPSTGSRIRTMPGPTINTDN